MAEILKLLEQLLSDISSKINYQMSDLDYGRHVKLKRDLEAVISSIKDLMKQQNV